MVTTSVGGLFDGVIFLIVDFCLGWILSFMESWGTSGAYVEPVPLLFILLAESFDLKIEGTGSGCAVGGYFGGGLEKWI